MPNSFMLLLFCGKGEGGGCKVAPPSHLVDGSLLASQNRSMRGQGHGGEVKRSSDFSAATFALSSGGSNYWTILRYPEWTDSQHGFN